jgi:hypothetical protein
MQFRPIEMQRALNRHAGFNLMEWQGLQDRLTLTVTCTQKLRCPNSSFHHDLIFMHSWDWTLEEIRYRLFMICHELQAGACQSPIEPLSRDWHSDSLSLRALLMETGS